MSILSELSMTNSIILLSIIKVSLETKPWSLWVVYIKRWKGFENFIEWTSNCSACWKGRWSVVGSNFSIILSFLGKNVEILNEHMLALIVFLLFVRRMVNATINELKMGLFLVVSKYNKISHKNIIKPSKRLIYKQDVNDLGRTRLVLLSTVMKSSSKVCWCPRYQEYPRYNYL